jgi:hypothetical protein
MVRTFSNHLLCPNPGHCSRSDWHEGSRPLYLSQEPPRPFSLVPPLLDASDWVSSIVGYRGIHPVKSGPWWTALNPIPQIRRWCLNRAPQTGIGQAGVRASVAANVQHASADALVLRRLVLLVQRVSTQKVVGWALVMTLWVSAVPVVCWALVVLAGRVPAVPVLS